jgi:predicted flap endonuclease-1-like 5' DNA nuclease
MANKKAKKQAQLQEELLSKIKEMLQATEARLQQLIEGRIQAVETQVSDKKAAKAAKKAKEAKESPETVAPSPETTPSEDQPTPTGGKRGRPKQAKEEAPVVETVAVVEEEAKPAKTRRPRRTAEEIAAEKEANVIPEGSIRHLKGIGQTYADKLAPFGIVTLEDFAKLTEADVERIDETIKGFKSRCETNGWFAQANELLGK